MTRIRNTFSLLTIVALAVGSPPGAFSGQSPLSPPEIFDKCLPSVVTLHILTTTGDAYVATAFVVSAGGVAATAWHVVHDAATVRATLPDGSECRMLKLLGRDEAHDLALIALERTDLPALPFAKEAPKVGSRVYTIGTPRGYAFSFVEGMLNQVQAIDSFPQYQVSCPISRGNSGGPLLNAHGEVTGLISWTRKNAQNLSFAVPSRFLTALLADAASSLPSPTPYVTEAGRPIDLTPVPLTTSAGSAAQIETETLNVKVPAVRSGLDTDRADATKTAVALDIHAGGMNGEESSNRSFKEFRQLLESAGSQSIHVTITKGESSQKFQFVVPENPFRNGAEK
ncbi:MAG TPA: serine protease [Methylomirabilota bacterium]|nr:serine protease [Methylomirabilota bacterium]